MANFDLVVGDGGSRLRVTIKEEGTDALIDLSGRSVTLNYSLAGAAVQQRTMTVLNQANAKVEAEYQFLSSDLNTAGELRGEVVLQEGQADQLTTVDTVNLRVKATLA